MAQAPEKKAVRMVKLSIRDRTLLYSSYMSFLRTGGIFLTSAEEFDMGDEVMLILEVMEHNETFPLRTTVVWKNPKGNNPMKPGGVGLAFPNDDIGKSASRVIENNLAGLLDNPRPTYTM